MAFALVAVWPDRHPITDPWTHDHVAPSVALLG